MRGIDWDKVRRDRNARKPNYREAFRREWNPVEWTLSIPPVRSGPQASKPPQGPVVPTRKPLPALTTPHGPKTFPLQSLPAGEIAARLKPYGIRGTALRKQVQAILKGETNIAWVEFDLQVKQMKEDGFQPCPVERHPAHIIMRFRKISETGEIQEERVYTLRRPAPEASG